MVNLKRRRILKKIYSQIKKNNIIVIARHIGADPDALGSQFSLKEMIQNKYPKKEVYAIGKPSNRFKFMGELDTIDEESFDYQKALLIVLDTPDIKRIDGVDINNYKNIIKIDHHPKIDDYANIELVDESSSSTCQLILELFYINKLKITKNIAEKIYMGIVADTGRFMHNYTTTNTFKLVTKMLEDTNINFTSLYEKIYMRPISEIKFQGYIFKNLELTENGVAYIEITDETLKEYGVDTSSAGNIISELKYIDEVLVWIFLTEDKKTSLIRANIRSRGPIINDVASKYGGGGHKLASGARLNNWEEAKSLIKDLDEITNKYIEEQ